MQKLITKAIEKAINETPYGSTDGQRGKAKVIARIFGGPLTAYILEGYQQEGEKWDGDMVYGLVNIGYGFEYGPFSIKELVATGYPFMGMRMPFERDIYVDVKKETLAEIAELHHEKDAMPDFVFETETNDEEETAVA